MTTSLKVQTIIGAAGNRLCADVGGPERAPAAILLHGGGQTRHSWHGTQHQLIEMGYRAIAFDMRGHGESDWIDDGNYAAEGTIDDIRAVVRAAGGRPALIGASMGGMNALLACGEEPGLASALVLVDVTPTLRADGVDKIRSFMHANPNGFVSLEEAADAVAAYNPLRPRPRNPEGLRKNLRLRDDGRWYWHWDPRLFSANPHTQLRSLSQRMLAAARRIQVPVLLLRGRESDVVGDDGVMQLQECIPHLQYRAIEGAGHMIAGDRNDAFATAMMDFLASEMPAKTI